MKHKVKQTSFGGCVIYLISAGTAISVLKHTIAFVMARNSQNPVIGIGGSIIRIGLGLRIADIVTAQWARLAATVVKSFESCKDAIMDSVNDIFGEV